MTLAFFWFLLNIGSIIVLAFYSMSEMACVSFNKVRLQYYVSEGNKRAEWLNWLLHNPTRLFGTTLIGVNVATFFGSEFAREFHSAIGIDPDFSPISQVFLVVLFGELAPMFAARRYAEHVAMLSVPLLYGSAKILAPFIWLIGLVTRLCSKLFGFSQTDSNIYLNQEELQKILEEHDEDRPPGGSEVDDFNAATAHIFSLRHKTVRQVMRPIHSIKRIPSNATVAQVMNVLRRAQEDYVAVYHRVPSNIVGIAHVNDLIRVPENRRVRDYAHPPWFVTQTTSLMQILHQFRRSKEIVAIILDKQGNAEGIVRLDDIMETLQGPNQPIEQMTFIERTLPGDMTVGQFNEQFDVELDVDLTETLEELIVRHLGHHPEVGESIFLDPYELTVEETSLRGVRSVSVTTRIK